MKKQTKEQAEDSKRLRHRIVDLIDRHPSIGYQEFLEELATDVEARLECLREEAEGVE